MDRAMLAAMAVLLLAAEPALAQQAVGAAPASLREGLLVGLGRPLADLAPLAAVIAVGTLAAGQAKGAVLAVAGYVAASVLGASAHIGEATVPNAMIFAALSVVALGLLVIRKTPLRRDVVFSLFGGSGLINGYMMGSTIAAAQREAIVGYLVGLAAIEFATALMVMYGMRMLSGREALQLLAVRVAGGFAVGAGAAMLLTRYAGA